MTLGEVNREWREVTMGADVSPVAPRISVVIPARDEVRHVLVSLAAVHEALDRVGGGEILVIDGMSTDGTRELVEGFAREHPGTRLLDNPARTTPAAFNIGICSARGALIAIVSAHSIVGGNFFESGLTTLDSVAADIVGGPISAEPGAPGVLPWLLSMVVRHPFGVGNSQFRISSSPSYVDAVPFAVFPVGVFHKLGLFNESLPRNQDTEFFGRVRTARLRVFLDPGMSSVYIARSTIAGLLRQGFLNAYWNVLVWCLNPAAFRWRHLIPGLFAIVLITTIVAGVWLPMLHSILWLCLAGYLSVAVVASIHVAAQARRVSGLILPPFFFLYHFSYGCGTIVGLRHVLEVALRGRAAWRPPPWPPRPQGQTE